MIEGKITRISGPIVYAEGLDGCGLYDVVDVGNAKLIGEIIRLKEGNATIQVYEDDTGMHVGEKIVSYGRPLSLRLGPGLVGTIYDGIQRPLKNMFDAEGSFLKPGLRTDPLDTSAKWKFTPLVKKGDPIAPGTVIGEVPETSSVKHKIMVPPYVRGRSLTKIAEAGSYTIEDLIAETDLGEKITLAQYWPVRKPRPYAQKMTVSQPLITGQRVIDVFFPLSKAERLPSPAASVPVKR